MKRYGNLFSGLVSFENLFLAYRKALKGTARSQEVFRFMFSFESELLSIQHDLHRGTYAPKPYRYFEIFEPKQRTISVAAFRDRVVHHAVVNILEPIFERVFYFHSYATRKGKGTPIPRPLSSR